MRDLDSQNSGEEGRVYAVLQEYVAALNRADMAHIKALSIGPAYDELAPDFKAGGRGIYPKRMIADIKLHGDVEIEKFETLASGHLVYVAEVYTTFSDQRSEMIGSDTFYPYTHVMFNLFNLRGEWKVLTIEKYMDYNEVEGR
ncbi:hypothetical protein [Mycobacteroides abscessus]|uniref:hypothetical protein n=1 Tax=Mycobacteroides abscessus TaxID=36809 RepID=UPI000C268A2D|nr:hypothetical protein [Mycobacteroides abscessus]RIT57533.1 hypothetical protein D2E90_22120 [Mycobacteroides abscessus]